MYQKKIIDELGMIEEVILFHNNGTVWSIPTDHHNRHYQEYLEWIAEGNEPEVIEPEVIE